MNARVLIIIILMSLFSANLYTFQEKTFVDHFDRTTLHVAAANGQVEIIRTLLAEGADIEEQRISFRTPLHYAAENGQTEAVRALLEAGANIEAQIFGLWTSLHLASRKGHAEVVKALLEAGANIEAQDPQQKAPLHLAAFCGHTEVIRALLKAHANIEAQTNNRMTPLHCAAEKGHIGAIGVLLAAGANIEAQDTLQRTPLHIAAEKGNCEIIKLLVQYGAQINQVDQQNKTACDIVQDQAIIDYLRSVLQLYNDLVSVVRMHDIDAVRKLIAQSAPVLRSDEHGNTVIHQAIEQSAENEPTVLDYIARTLIKAVGARAVVVRNHEGQTLLHCAVKKNNLWIAKYLLHHGADVNAQDNQGNMPLHYAGYKDIRDELLKYGADVSVINHSGQTPISCTINLWLPDLQRLVLIDGKCKIK